MSDGLKRSAHPTPNRGKTDWGRPLYDIPHPDTLWATASDSLHQRRQRFSTLRVLPLAPSPCSRRPPPPFPLLTMPTHHLPHRTADTIHHASRRISGEPNKLYHHWLMPWLCGNKRLHLIFFTSILYYIKAKKSYGICEKIPNFVAYNVKTQEKA